MKLDELILEATKDDLVGTDADSILAMARQKKSTAHTFSGWKKAILIAAAVCLLVGTVSATALLSGFGNTFSRPVDTGNVTILSSESTNKKVKWNLTEVWYDEFTLFIGGTVITPEPLSLSEEHSATCQVWLPGENRFDFMILHVYPTGEKESSFIMKLQRDESPLTVNEAAIALKISNFYDRALIPRREDGSYSISIEELQQYLNYPGEWRFELALTNSNYNAIHVAERYESRAEYAPDTVVTSVTVTPFTLKVEGEALVHRYISSFGGYGENPMCVMLRMKDGTYLGGSERYEYKESRICYFKNTPECILYRFSEPIDPAEVDAIILETGWAYFAERDKAFMEESGYVVMPDVTWDGKCLGYCCVFEIPAP
ncbi:MAG: DUF4179 domain-containing protein [Clostridia bacterium]|nr:DUF4179 domain-containing protein [Clostridia bacterium]